MRWKEIVSEAFLHGFTQYGKAVEIFKNPSPSELKKLIQYGQVRAFLVGSDCIVWNTYAALHQQVREELKLPDTAIPLMLYLDLPSKSASAVITDNTKNTPLWHSPTVGSVVEEHPYLRRMFRELEVSYYDEDIYGDWTEIENEDEEDADDELTEAKRPPAPEHIEEALWWVTRYICGSLNDPDWDWGEPTHLNINQAMEIVGLYVGNTSSIGKPLYRFLNISQPKAKALQQSLVLTPSKHGFQSFTVHGEQALEIGFDIHPTAKIGTVVCAEVPASDVLFGMADLKRARRLPGVADTYDQLSDWHHQGEVIVRVTGPLKLSSVQITKAPKVEW